MKAPFVTLVAAVALLVAPSAVFAAECTQAELDTYTKLGAGTEAQEACAGILKAAGVTKIDSTTFAALNPCNDAKCLAYYESYAKGLSDCTLQGIMLRQPIDALLSVCKRTPGGPPPVPITLTTMPTTGTTTAPANNSSTTSKAPSSTTAAPVPSPTSSASLRNGASVVVALLVPAVAAGLAML